MSVTGRHVGQMRRRLVVDDRERLDFAGVEIRLQLDRRARHHRDVTGQQVGEGGRDAAVRHVDHVEAGGLEHEHRGDMGGAADARRTEGELARVRLHVAR